MIHANGVYDTRTRELNNSQVCDSRESTEKKDSLSFEEEMDEDDIPSSLLNYFESSKSRAAVCEKLILEEPEDFFASHHTEAVMKINEQVVGYLETSENSASSDNRLLCAPTETDECLTQDWSNIEGEAETGDHEDVEEHLMFETKLLDIRLDEEVKKEELRRQTEEDFQKELKRIREAEKLQQRELELMEKKAQEKLEEELQLQQEVISNLQRRVKEERKRIEEEQRRLKEEEQERMKKEEERKRVEEVERKGKDEERKIEEMKKEERKKKLEEEQRRRKEEDRRKKMEEERGRLKEEQEEEERRKEAERKRAEEAERKRKDEERQREEMKLQKEEEERRLKEEEEEKKREEAERRKEAERRMMEEAEGRRKKDEERQIEEMKKEEERKKMEEEKRRREKEKQKLEDEMRKKKEEEEKVRRMEREKRKREQEMIQEEKERNKIKEENLRSEEERRKRVEEEEQKRKRIAEERKEEERTHEDERKEDRKREEVDSQKRRFKGETEEKKKQRREEGEKERKEEEVKKEEMDKDEEEEEEREDERGREMEEKKDGGEEQRWERNKRKTEDRDRLKGFDVDERKGEDKKEEVRVKGEEEVQRKRMDEAETQTSSSVSFISTETRSRPGILPQHTEQRRLSWMKECVSWSKLSLQNRRRHRASHQEGRGVRKASGVRGLPPLCSDLLLQSTESPEIGVWRSLREVTTVTLEDLPGCSLSPLSQCSQLQSLTLRRCGLRSLEGINQLPQLSYINVQDNEISFIDCENLTSLRVLNLSHNKLTSIHGLTGAENLEVLELSHNSITRIAGLESMKRLQKLSLDHNQLINTKGLRDVYTLLHLDCSHNHLLRVEGVENCGLLSTLDLRANSLTEPPGLKNQVLLRDLRLDDNSLCSLQSLADCWLPLLQRLSAAQNRLTELPPLSDAVSLSYLDLSFNCLSELQSVMEGLEGCLFLQELHLTGNPLQQDGGWRSTLYRALPSLKAIDDPGTDSSLTPPAVQQFGLPSGSFLALCQAQLQQTHELQQRHSRELSEASSPLGAGTVSCRHLSEALQLAVDHRLAHEYGQTSDPDEDEAADQTAEDLETEFRRNAAAVHHDAGFTGASGSTFSRDSTNTSAAAEERSSSSDLELVPESNLQQRAAVVIQQLWRKYRQKCGNMTGGGGGGGGRGGGGGGGGGGELESGPAVINRRAAGNHYAATVIQAGWRGFALRRRLASALAAVTCSDTGEDDTLEEVDVDEFVFDEEKDWTPLFDDPPSRCLSVSEQQLTLKLPEPSRYKLPPQHVRRSKQAWVDEGQEDCGGQRGSPLSSVRSNPPSTSVPSGLTRKSEKILEEWGFTHSHTALMMLRRAQKMKSRKQQPKKRPDPSAHWTLLRNCSYQMKPVGVQKRRGNHPVSDVKGGELDLDLDLDLEQDGAQQRLHAQAALLPDRDSESVRFLPELSACVLNGGRVQLVADPGYSKRPHHGSGCWASSRENRTPHRNSWGHERKEVPSPKRDSSAPSKKERISFRDTGVQLSGGWGGGKKRDRVLK